MERLSPEKQAERSAIVKRIVLEAHKNLADKVVSETKDDYNGIPTTTKTVEVEIPADKAPEIYCGGIFLGGSFKKITNAELVIETGKSKVKGEGEETEFVDYTNYDIRLWCGSRQDRFANQESLHVHETPTETTYYDKLNDDLFREITELL